MKKLFPMLAFVLVIGACLPSGFPGAATPTALIQATSTSSSVAPTEPIPPTGTVVPVEFTVTPVISSPTAPSSASLTPPPNLTTTLATSTDLPQNLTVTSTVTPPPSGATLTPTLGILKYGTLPPAVPFNTVTLWNRSKAQAYISLQVTTNEGYFTIIEYPVEGQVRVKAPLGSYVYVAWVGGNKLTGSFRLTSTDSLVITLFKDKVVIK